MRKQMLVSWHARARDLLATTDNKRQVAIQLNSEGLRTIKGTEITYQSVCQFVQAERVKNSPYNIPGSSAHTAGIRSSFNEDRN